MGQHIQNDRPFIALFFQRIWESPGQFAIAHFALSFSAILKTIKNRRFKQEGAAMDLQEAIATKIKEYDNGSIGGDAPGFDTWDNAARDYLESVRQRLASGENAVSVHEHLLADLPRLEELVEAEEASYTFDWYDDHYYAKIYSGQLQACKYVLSLFGDEG